MRAFSDQTAAADLSEATPDNAEQAKQYALEHSFQNASAVSEKRLKAEALAYPWFHKPEMLPI